MQKRHQNSGYARFLFMGVVEMSITNETTKKIYSYLTKNNLTPEGAAGLMGNLYAESGCLPNRVETLCLQRLRERGRYFTDATYTAFVDDGTIGRAEFLNPLPNCRYGYGLAQWTSISRKAGLYDRCKAAFVSIGDLNTQLQYLMHELKTIFNSVYKVLTTTRSVREASDIVLKKFEMPSDTGERVQLERYGYAKQFYDAYAGKEDPGVSKVTAKTILDIYRSWIGCNERDGSHQKIIDIYNSYTPSITFDN